LTPHSEVNAALRPFENFILVVVFAYMDNIILNSFDLRKAFDTIWRVGLFYKLLKSHMPKKLFNIILSMYANTTTYNKQLTERSPALTGSQLPVTKSLTISSIKIKKKGS
jgi:hypothetical protein